MNDHLSKLAEFISNGLNVDKTAREMLEPLFGERYRRRHNEKTLIRDALKLGTNEDKNKGVPFAGLINPDNPESGPYGGTSVVWFPTKEHGSLITLVVGTRGLSPDEGILTRPGHRRRIVALRKYLARKGVEAWSKPDPANLSVTVPKVTHDRFPGFENAIKRYEHEMYCIAQVPADNPSLARLVVKAFFDLYSYERGWEILTDYKSEREELLGFLRQDIFPKVSIDLVCEMLKARHFVILQGPPGTGKTRLAEEVCKRHFDGKGMTIQFHPAVTYEDFVVGLSPDISQKDSLRFGVQPGWLIQACQSAEKEPFLLIIDEINRADLGKVLGEAIYLFEADRVGERFVDLNHPVEGYNEISLHPNLFVLGTMNTADRSIANIDLAIRRRFSFIRMMPERQVVVENSIPAAVEFFDRICDVFIEHAPSDMLDLLPGHSYFLADNEEALTKRLLYELLPLLDEYIREGFLGPATTELNAVRDTIEDAIQ